MGSSAKESKGYHIGVRFYKRVVQKLDSKVGEKREHAVVKGLQGGRRRGIARVGQSAEYPQTGKRRASRGRG